MQQFEQLNLQFCVQDATKRKKGFATLVKKYSENIWPTVTKFENIQNNDFLWISPKTK